MTLVASGEARLQLGLWDSEQTSLTLHSTISLHRWFLVAAGCPAPAASQRLGLLPLFSRHKLLKSLWGWGEAHSWGNILVSTGNLHKSRVRNQNWFHQVLGCHFSLWAELSYGVAGTKQGWGCGLWTTMLGPWFTSCVASCK